MFLADGGEHGQWQTADEYLSGNVRQKLRIARSVRSARPDPCRTTPMRGFAQAQPKDSGCREIEVRLGATWLDKEVYQAVHV